MIMLNEADKQKLEFQKKFEDVAEDMAYRLSFYNAIDFIATSSFFAYIQKSNKRYRMIITSWGREQREIDGTSILELKQKALEITADW